MSCAFKKFDITEVTLEDEKEVLDIIQEGFRHNDGLFLPIKPTKHNAKIFYNLEVRHCIINQDPVYFFKIDNKVLGFSCCATDINSAYDMDRKIALGVITIVKKEFRRKGIATELRQNMLANLRAKGVEFVLCDISVSNTPSLDGCNNIASSLKLDNKEISKRYECRI
jgi:ribosomal protein S18 acetylase RimI-like enzyme